MRLRRGPVWPAATAALGALTFVTAISCRGVFGDWSFLPLLVAVAVTVHGLMALSRMFNAPLLLATPVAALATAAVIGRRMYPGTIRLGFLPTRGTWDAAWIDLRDAWRQFDTASAPVPAAGGFLLAAALAIAVAAFAADTFGFRAFGRVEAVVPTGVVYTFVAALGVQDEASGIDYGRIWSGVIWLFTACVCVALLRSAHGDLGNTWLGGRRRERTLRIAGTAGALSLITVAVAFVIAPKLPGAGEAPLIDPGNDGSSDVRVVSPIVDIKKRLVNRSNRVMFRVEADRAAYWRLMSLTEFNGSQWGSDERFEEAVGALGSSNPAQGADLVQRVTIDQMGGGWVPAALEPAFLATTDDLLYSPTTSTLRVADDGTLYPGMTYTVTSTIPRFTVDELRAATADAPPDPALVVLPDDFPEHLRELAADIASGAATPFDQAIALQSYFQDNFDYDTNVPAGHSESAIETFINQRRGYCEQFAGTFAAFGRSLGLATRVAVGFTSGVIDDDGRFVVRGRNAHAWPEVWFDGLGWVMFEPTPGRGAPDAEYTGVTPTQDTVVGPDNSESEPAPANPGNTSNVTVPRETAPSGNGDVGPSNIPLGPLPATPVEGGGGSFPIGLVVITVLVVLAILWIAVVPRLVLRRAHRRRGQTPADRVTVAWAESGRALQLIGAGRGESETPLEHAHRAAKLTGIDRDSLRWLANAAMRAVYATDTLDEATAHESERIRHDVAEGVKARASWGTRMRSHLDPRVAAALQ